MHVIDRYAYSNAVRLVDPAHKGALAIIAILLCIMLDRPLVGIVTVGWMLLLATRWARLPLRVFGRTLLAEGLFLMLSVLGVAVSVSLTPFGPEAMVWQLGPLWLSTSPAAIAIAVRLLTRALGCAAAMNFLILTTPLVDLIELLRRLRLPEVLIDLMTVTYRTIFVLFESLERMSIAQDARLGYSTPQRAMQSAALLANQLFLDAYRRSQKLQNALESRGMSDGALKVLPISYTTSRYTWWYGAAIAASLLVVGVLT